MKPLVLPRTRCPQRLRHSQLRNYYILQLPTASQKAQVDLAAFQRRAFIPEAPLLFKQRKGSLSFALPAIEKWFQKGSYLDYNALSDSVKRFHHWPFPYELVRGSRDGRDEVVSFQKWLLESPDAADHELATVLNQVTQSEDERSFFQLVAPLALLSRALEFNRIRADRTRTPIKLYIAQSSLSELPPELQADVPTPEVVLKAGKGDIYGSSIWLGTEPTYTPLHKDPNPNLFCQIHSIKLVRLLSPACGNRLFASIQKQLGKSASGQIRTADMMEGEEEEALHDAVWGEPDEDAEEENDEQALDIYQAELYPEDALFIPKGWWHSIRSVSGEGQLNCSANWWFR